MTLAQASKYFDRTLVTDPFTGARLFTAQVDPYDDTKRDAYSAYRRILSVAPGTQIPAHRTVRLMGMDWIVGSYESDGMQEIHRQKYVISQAPATLKVSSLAQYLAGQHTKVVRAAPYWNKDAKQVEVSSEQPQMFDVFVPTEVADKSVLWNASEAYFCMSPRPLASGLLSAFSLKLEHAAEPATLGIRTYDPVAGGYVTNGTASVQVLRVRWQSLFEYGSDAEVRYRPGDLSIVLPASPTVKTSTSITLPDATYQILSIDQLPGVQVAHCRRI